MQMDKKDKAYYDLKELNQEYDFWYNKANRRVPGAKVRLNNIRTKIARKQEEFEAL